MNIIDISWPITPAMTCYKDRSCCEVIVVKEFEHGGVRETRVHLEAHTGTHVDAPAHFLKDGAMIEGVMLESLIGRCHVIDCTGAEEKITATDLKKYDIIEGEIVLIKTKNSALSSQARYNPSFIYLDQSGAWYLVEKNVKAVGIDYLGIERNQAGHETHSALLEQGIPIIEGLRLEKVTPAYYILLCLPLALQGVEAGLARAVLLPPEVHFF